MEANRISFAALKTLEKEKIDLTVNSFYNWNSLFEWK